MLAPAVALSLWTAVPPIQWCPFTWDQCWAASASSADECHAASEAAASCATSCAAECELPTTAPESSGRAYCLLAPIGGIPTREVESPSASSGRSWHPVEAVDLEAPRSAGVVAGDEPDAIATGPPARLLPPSRAPPRA